MGGGPDAVLGGNAAGFERGEGDFLRSFDELLPPAPRDTDDAADPAP